MRDERRSASRAASRLAEHLSVLGLYSLLTVLLTYPVAAHLADAVPGVPGDVWSYVWAMGWARTGLNLGIDPFRNDFVFYPLGGATQLLWATALPSFASLPLQFVFGLIPAFNLIYLAATVLTAYGTYLLAREVLRSAGSASEVAVTAGAFVAGAAFAFCALRLGYGLAFTNLYHTELIPFYLLFLLRATRLASWRSMLLAGILLGLNAYVDFQIAEFLALFSVLWAGWVALSILHERGRIPVSSSAPPSAAPEPDREKRPALARRLVPLARLTAVGVIAAAVAAPMAAVVAQDLAAEGGNYIRVYPLNYSAARSYDLLSYFVPNGRSSLYRALPAPRLAGINAAGDGSGQPDLSPDRQAFLGLTVLALAVIGALTRRRGMAFWVFATFAFWLISLGPTLHAAGRDLGVPLPFAVLHEIPIANHIRIPMRYGLMAFLGAALLAGAGTQWLAARLSPLPAAGLVSALVAVEAAVLPYPTLHWSVPAIYNRIASEPGDFSVLEIPSFNWRSASANEVYQAVHGKRLLRAYTNRIAPDVADYFSQRQTPIVVRSLRLLEGAQDGALRTGEIAEDRAAELRVMGFFNLRYVIVHRDQIETDAFAAIDRYLAKDLGLQPAYDDSQVRAYSVALEPAASTRINVAANEGLMYLGRGWQTEPRADVDGETGRFLKGGTSEIYFLTGCDKPTQPVIPRCGGMTIQLRAYSEKAGAMLQWQLNGRSQGTVKLEPGWADYSLFGSSMPGDFVPSGMNTLRLVPADQQNRVALQSIEIY